MKKSLKLIAALSLLLGLTFCSDDATNPEGTASVNLVSEMPATSVSKAFIKDGTIEGSTADSLKISRVRILISQVKFYRDKDDISTEVKSIKTGPYLLTADANGTVLAVTNGTLPAGNYNKVKVEFHRFSSSDLPAYKNEPVFKDFATDGRYSAIIEGLAYRSGVAYPFVFNATSTENLKLTFNPSINMSANSTYTVSLLIDPLLCFKINGVVLDPTDTKNHNDLDNAIKNIIKTLKKK